MQKSFLFTLQFVQCIIWVEIDRVYNMEDIFELIEEADECLKNNSNIDNNIVTELENKLKDGGYIGIAQINPTVGDIENNAKKIAKYIKFSEKIGLKAVVFPEFSLIGNPLEDTLTRHPIVIDNNKKWLNGLSKLADNTIAVVGFVEPDYKEDGIKYSSSVAIIHHKEIQCIIRKNDKIKSYNGYGITIDSNESAEDVIREGNFKTIINCSAITAKNNHKLLNNKTLSKISAKNKTTYIFVNQTGANDNYLFDGISRVYNSNGEIISRLKAFEEQFSIVNPDKNIGKIYPLPEGFEKFIQGKNTFSLDYENELDYTYHALIQGIKDYFNKCGFKRAVLGLSGGLDSTVSAVLLADAIGKENVYGVSMPSGITSSTSKSDAELLAKNLGINFVEAPIRSVVDTISDDFKNLFNKIEKNWNCRYKQSFTHDNIQARSRATILWGISNEFSSCIPIATSDKSEAYMGYATVNGDMSGGYAPIADITKTKLFALARWINKNRNEKNVIPESVILKRPGAELAIDPKTGKPLIAEDALMPYEFLDEIIWRIENKQEGYNDFLNMKFVYEIENNITQEQKTEWLDKFYRRMSTAFYKWSIMVPSVMIEHHSINKIDYKQLITSSHINYKGANKEYINESLK